ncbi:MAG: hypothetical protein ACLQU1_13975 [Bryobacteraceae bacterium]
MFVCVRSSLPLPLYVPLVVLGELHFGAQRAPRRDDAPAQIREFPRISTLLPPDENTAGQYGDVKAELARIGRPIPGNDIRIAALADARFAMVPRLKTPGW